MSKIIAAQLPAIIVPTYNEVKNIELLVTKIASVLPTAKIIIVDDSSPDGTAQEVKKLQKKYQNLHLVLNKQKAGRGNAVQLGFRFALKNFSSTVMIEMDADFSHQPKELVKLIATVDNNTVALSSRYLPTSKIENWPIQRKVFSFLSNMILRVAIGLKVTDYTNGFRAYPRSAIEKLQSYNLICKSYLSLTEVLLILVQEGYQIKEIPGIFVNRTRGVSNTNWQEIKHNIQELIKIRKKYF